MPRLVRSYLRGIALKIPKIAAAVGALAFKTLFAQSEMPQATFDMAVQATAKIVGTVTNTDDVVATGFLYGSDDEVVTCLHVVIRTNQISVQLGGALYDGHISRVLKSADLVLLKLDRKTGQKPLKQPSSPPSLGAGLTALGFPLGAPVVKDIDARIHRAGASRLQDAIPTSELRRQITELGFPSLTTAILDLQSPLTYGTSGAPMLDKDGSVCGIAEGGLEQGMTELTWAVTANYLDELENSDELLPSGAGVFTKAKTLFAAELRAANGATVNLGGLTFVKLKTRKLEELLNYTDDKLGLSQVKAQFLQLSPDTWTFDIYRNFDTGIMFAAPSGSSFQNDGDDLTVTSNFEGESMRFRLETVKTQADVQPASVKFESEASRQLNAPLGEWIQNWQWSQPAPVYFPSGLVVRRRSYIVIGQGTPPPVYKYYFETFAVKGEYLLSVAAVDERYMNVFFDRAQQAWFGQSIIANQLSTILKGQNLPGSPESNSADGNNLISLQGIEGDWQGTLEGPNLPVVLHVLQGGDSTIDSPSEQGYGYLTKVSVNGSAVNFTVPSLGVIFKGSWHGSIISGTFYQNGQGLPLKLTRSGDS